MVAIQAQEDPQAPGPREPRPRPHRQAPQAPGRPRQRRRHAPPQDQLRQIPPRLLREGGHAPLPPEAQPELLPDRQPGQAVDPGQRADARQRGQEPGGGRPHHRRGAVGLLQGPGQGQAPQAAGHREGQVLQQESRGEDQGGRRGLCPGGLRLQGRSIKAVTRLPVVRALLPPRRHRLPGFELLCGKQSMPVTG